MEAVARPGPPLMSVAERVRLRFEEDVGPADARSGCRPWLGRRNALGYGLFSVCGGHIRAHRAAWELATGEAPGPLHVLHRCDNPPCVNVAHLFLGTPKDNSDDKIAKGRAHITRSFGEAHGLTKLTNAQVTEIKAAAGTERQRDTAARYGVAQSTIGRIQRGVSWKQHR